MRHANLKSAWITSLAVILLAGYPLDAREAQSDDSDTITITPADFNISKEKALERLADLEAMAAISVSTADYAEAFSEFQDDLPKVRPPVSEWSESEQERVEKLKQPTDAAWKALALEEQKARARQQQRNQAAQQDWAMRQQQALDQQRLNADRARTEQQLRLQEAQIRESEARTDYYEDLADDSWNSWFNPWWFHKHPGSPANRHRLRLYDPHQPLLKPMVPNNYEPRPVPLR